MRPGRWPVNPRALLTTFTRALTFSRSGRPSGGRLPARATRYPPSSPFPTAVARLWDRISLCRRPGRRPQRQLQQIGIHMVYLQSANGIADGPPTRRTGTFSLDLYLDLHGRFVDGSRSPFSAFASIMRVMHRIENHCPLVIAFLLICGGLGRSDLAIPGHRVCSTRPSPSIGDR